MAWNRRRINPVSVEEFFSLNSGKYSYEQFAEKVYVMVHTYYLSAQGKIKVEMGKTWDSDFGIYMTDETFEYMLVNEPVMLRDVIIDLTKQKQEIKSGKYLEKSLVAFEFDLWLIENHKKGYRLSLSKFEHYINEKYGDFLEDKYRSFKKYDLRYIENYENIVQGIEPFYIQILDIFDLIISNNRMRINFENESADRTRDYGLTVSSDRKVPLINESERQRTPVPSVEPKKTNIVLRAAESQVVTDNSLKTGNSSSNKIADDIRKDLEKEYNLTIKEKDERIEKLEKDIREFKRQRDEAREYSANQYDRGIKDLFSSMNDERYGKVIDYFYSLLRSDSADDQLASYLDNLFMSLEDMEIVPIVDDGDPDVNEGTMLKEYNLDFNKESYDASKVKLKYAGWSYKGITIEKPTITMKED